MNRRTFTSLAFGAIAAPTLTLFGCTPADNSGGWQNAIGTKVLASFAPIQCFALNVAGEDATVRVLFGEQGPHHIKDNPNHVYVYAGADVLFVNGLGLEDRQVRRLEKSTPRSVPIISLGNSLPESMLLEGGCECCKEEDHDHAHHDHDTHTNDPHVWLGLDPAVKMVEMIRDQLKKANPAKAANFDSRAEQYIEKLKKLKADGVAMLKDKKERQFISFHDSLKYFAKTFDMKEPEVIQMNPGQEPTKKELDKLLARCVKNQIRVIAIEPQYGSGTSAKTIETALKVANVDSTMIVLDPLETATDGEMNAEWYETKMRANLEALAKALK